MSAKAVVSILLLFTIVACKYEVKKYPILSESYTKTNLNIRYGPGTDRNIIETVKPNTMLHTYDSIVNGFVMVLNDDSTSRGWTSKQYLQAYPLSKGQLAALVKKAETNRSVSKPKKSTSSTSLKPSQDKIFGQWNFTEGNLKWSVIIYSVNNRYKLKSVYSDGSSGVKDVVLSMNQGKTMFAEPNNDDGEFYLVESDGSLGSYDDLGFVRKGRKVKLQ